LVEWYESFGNTGRRKVNRNLIEPVKAVAMSVKVELAHVDEIVAPVTTGLPDASEYIPLPFLDITVPLDSDHFFVAI